MSLAPNEKLQDRCCKTGTAFQSWTIRAHVVGNLWGPPMPLQALVVSIQGDATIRNFFPNVDQTSELCTSALPDPIRDLRVGLQAPGPFWGHRNSTHCSLMLKTTHDQCLCVRIWGLLAPYPTWPSDEIAPTNHQVYPPALSLITTQTFWVIVHYLLNVCAYFGRVLYRVPYYSWSDVFLCMLALEMYSMLLIRMDIGEYDKYYRRSATLFLKS